MKPKRYAEHSAKTYVTGALIHFVGSGTAFNTDAVINTE